MTARHVRASILIAAITACVLTAGCSAAPKKTAPEATSAEVSETLAPVVADSGDIEYIRSLGKSHKGETLQLLIIASEKSEQAATKLLVDTLPSFGDVQPYLIVEPTAHFKGLTPGLWIVCEVYREAPSAETVDFMNRGPNADAYVKQATVLCSDSIPVVDDIEGEGTQ